ncbi:hypothetical protein [Streptomyces sp. NPDC016845]|uniref:hypothetical protein n=1 Tax=Streptomyces sp. NPDC016845 TaxID=3364972 RepID=UPI0037B5D6BF
MSLGPYVIDIRDGRVGQVMAREGGFVQLRPPGGGVEWDCPPEAVSPAPVLDELRARVRVVNQEGRLP